MFRDSALNAQNALAATKPPEQRRIYEGHVTGPIPHFAKSGFLVSFNRAEEDLDAVVLATLRQLRQQIPADCFRPTSPRRRAIRSSAPARRHQFGDKHSAYAQYSLPDWNAQNQGVGGQSLASAGYTQSLSRRRSDLSR